MQQITTKFGIELNVALGAAEEPATESMRSSRPAKPVVTLDDASNPQWIATQAGFSVGKLYKRKLAAENASAPVYQLEGMDHAGITFVMQVLNAPIGEELKQLKKVVAYDNLDGWKEFEGRMPEVIPEDKVESTTKFVEDHHKVAIFMVLMEVSHEPDDLD